MNKKVLNQLKGGLIVSCQALEYEPLHSSYIMQRMAVAAMQGGAVGIRANSVQDIVKIKEEVALPVIGIIKKDYPDSEIYITPTMDEVDALVESGVEIIAMDSTKRLRPGGVRLDTFFKAVKEKYPEQIFMADCSDYEEGIKAANLGFDVIGTTLRRYTSYTKDVQIPDYEYLQKLVKDTGKIVIAEGGIWTPEQLEKVFEAGAFAAVVGTAITRPCEITKHFVSVIQKKEVACE
ncbi:MAG: N-acetylmannosamine-6-phosphate 2-epimerase [Lachnospiraceae bacterium]|nr:N-acetylmannosamine-6-phosphate 2-epimerase [Lachnospiraceae bacterium]GFI02403.1 putative N-acetylmannosamine-6-phosphate 2-epimerase [Lachnospiraceae bacterium]